MLVFVDESGDAGMKVDAGSSPYFVVTAVVFKTQSAAESAHGIINALRQRLEWNPRQEFHFNKCNRQVRQAFLEAISQCDFEYSAFIVNKRGLYGRGFQFKESFYKYFIKIMFQNMKPLLRDADVVIDKTGDRSFRQEFSTYLKKHVNPKGGPRCIKSVTTQRSHANNLIQLTDMICGAVARSLRTDVQDSQLYRGIVGSKERQARFWPAHKKTR